MRENEWLALDLAADCFSPMGNISDSMITGGGGRKKRCRPSYKLLGRLQK